ncbi:transcription factor GAGA [Bradysia coprophila]|uniref:transcription factor GAGA n=1 Tax=Bradysia coprophila TaxID=38358 RepID=UPI00187D7417|nr:transcription factor GAGA [Bradysia coprophila]
MSLPINSLYSLTWGDYGTSLVSAVQLLRCHGDLVDCTLAAGGRSFPAHKIVLCAASPFLLELLKNTPCKHPVVMLAGVNASDLEALLEFVYRGEVSVDHSQLPSLLQAAHCLNIQGLAPQTISKDDYTTQIQIHPGLIPQHHLKAVIDVGNGTMVSNEELMTIHEADQHQTVQAHVVEEILPHDITEVVGDVKDVINQFLPNRKRKPRAKKPTNAKVLRIDENIQIQPPTQQQQQQQQPQQQQMQVQNESKSNANAQNGEDNKSNIVVVKTEKPLSSKPKSRSQSEQPASCPICGAVIRQSRNLRRHLELRHFSKPGVKSNRKSSTNSANTSSSSATTTQNTTGQGNVQTIRTLTVKKEPEDSPSTSTQQTIALTVTPTSTMDSNNGNAQHHIVTQHENTDGTTSLSIAQVQGHQLIGNLNQATIQIRNDDPLESNLITTHEPTLRPHTELFRVGAVYTLEERRIDNSKLT